MTWRGRALFGSLFTLGVLAALLLWTAWRAPLPERLSSAGSTVVTFHDGRVAHAFLAPDDRWRVAGAKVDPDYVEALLRYEDKRFYWHVGTDPIAVARALAVNLSHGRVMTGASTLTSQLVRVLEPRPRSLTSKLTESHRALTLELHLSKQEILEAYLAFAPYGGNLEGVEAASLAFFGHSADHLSPDEIAVLLAVPQNPTARRPTVAHESRLRQARDDIAHFLAEAGVFNEDELDDIARAQVPTRLRPFPRHAPHLAQRLRRQHAPGSRIPTVLDPGLQRMTERLVSLERTRLQGRGIDNGAVVLVHRPTRTIRAAVGNLGFLEEGRALQISALDEPRSPGSTLKPFLYAQGIDEGRVLPQTLVKDIPIAWRAYTPRNYDGTFRGLVPLETALSLSLNVPFVELLDDIGIEPFIGTLKDLGIRSLNDRAGHYGLSLAAGGVEMTPIELAGLYTTLADGGLSRALKLQPGPDGPSMRVFSPAAAHLTAKTLRLRDRPDLPTRHAHNHAVNGIAWKTGTSFGHRDAWAAGFGEEYVAVVWLGNLDYRPARALVGSEAAGPLLFDVLEAVEGTPELPEPPDDIARVEVCAYSGRIPSVACPHRVHVDAARASVPTEMCAFHQRFAVDTNTEEALTPRCQTSREWEERDFLVLPSSVRRYLADRNDDLPPPPAWAEGCQPAELMEPPRIQSIEADQVAVLIPGIAATDQEIPLAAEGSGRLSWFLDGAFLGTRDAAERLWWPPTLGRHTVTVQDEAGQEDRRTFLVRDPTRGR